MDIVPVSYMHIEAFISGEKPLHGTLLFPFVSGIDTTNFLDCEKLSTTTIAISLSLRISIGCEKQLCVVTALSLSCVGIAGIAPFKFSSVVLEH